MSLIKKIEDVVDKRVDDYVTNLTNVLINKINIYLDDKTSEVIKKSVDNLIMSESKILKELLINDINKIIKKEAGNCTIN